MPDWTTFVSNFMSFPFSYSKSAKAQRCIILLSLIVRQLFGV